MIHHAKQEAIRARLEEIERAEEVHVLYACESGSRAWGFASTDSDYDVRFIYAHPVEWYLSVHQGRDVIELPLEGDLDISGWDVRKALALLMKSNPPLLEWFQSPFVYRRQPDFMDQILELLPAFYSPKKCLHHYLHMAKGNMREYLKGERVWTKKYFYILRPVMSCIWIEQGWGPVPIEFERLLERVLPEGLLRDAVERLMADKREGRELDEGPRIPSFHDFFDEQVRRLELVAAGMEDSVQPSTSVLDELFRFAIEYPLKNKPVSSGL